MHPLFLIPSLQLSPLPYQHLLNMISCLKKNNTLSPVSVSIPTWVRGIYWSIGSQSVVTSNGPRGIIPPFPRRHQLPFLRNGWELDIFPTTYVGILTSSSLHRTCAGRRSLCELMSVVSHGMNRRQHFTAPVAIVQLTVIPLPLLWCLLSLGRVLSLHLLRTLTTDYESLCWLLSTSERSCPDQDGEKPGSTGIHINI